MLQYFSKYLDSRQTVFVIATNGGLLCNVCMKQGTQGPETEKHQYSRDSAFPHN